MSVGTSYKNGKKIKETIWIGEDVTTNHYALDGVTIVKTEHKKKYAWFFDVYDVYRAIDTKGDSFYDEHNDIYLQYVSEYDFLNKHDAMDYCQLLNGDEYEDNYRYARVDNAEELKEYRRAIEGGCCGSNDYLCKISGEWYYVGFNFGH